MQEPDSTLLISGAMHRDWPDARGMFVNDKKNALVWVNEEDHMRVISMEMGHDIVNVFKRFVDLCNNVSGYALTPHACSTVYSCEAALAVRRWRRR